MTGPNGSPTRGAEAADLESSGVIALASGGALNLVGGATSAIAGFGFTVIVARSLHASRAGAFYEAIALFSILAVVCQLGVPTAIVRSISKQRAVGHVDEARTTIAVASVPPFVFACIVAGLMYGLAPWLSGLLAGPVHRPAVAEYLRIFAFALPLATGSNIALGITRGFGTMVPTAIASNIVEPVSRIVLALFLFALGSAVRYAAATWVAPITISFVVAILLTKRLLRGPPPPPGRPGRAGRARVARDFWRFALPQWLSGFLQVGVAWLDVLLLGALANERDAGTYATLSRYLLVGTLVLGAIVLAISPLLGGMLARGQIASAAALYRLGTAWICTLAVPIYVVMAVFAPVFMGFFGASFSDGSKPLAILAVAMLANVAAGPVVTVLLMGGRSDLVLWDSVAAFVVNIVLNALLIPTYGMNGAALAWAASIVLLNGVAGLQAYRLWGIQPYSGTLLQIIAGSAISYGLLGLLLDRLMASGSLALVTTSMVGTMLYGTLLWRARRQLASSVVLSAWRQRRLRLGGAST